MKISKHLNLTRNLFLLLLPLFISFSSIAQGDLLVYPKKLLFEGTQERVKVLDFRNEGRDTATYKLSYIENRMSEDGELKVIKEPEEGQKFASPYLRFYPRSITLAPGELQTVKVQLTRTNALETGEYRSHLYIRAEEKTKALKKKEPAQEEEGFSIELTAIYGISIPNIIRIGDTEVKSDLKDLTFNKKDEILSMKVTRHGSQSVYGTLEVVHINPHGIETPVGKQGLAIYSPGNLRIHSMKLNTIEGIDYTSGTLRVTFTNQEDGKEILSAASLNL